MVTADYIPYGDNYTSYVCLIVSAVLIVGNVIIVGCLIKSSDIVDWFNDMLTLDQYDGLQFMVDRLFELLEDAWNSCRPSTIASTWRQCRERRRADYERIIEV